MGPLASQFTAHAAHALRVNLPWLFFLRTFFLHCRDECVFEIAFPYSRQDSEGQYRQQEQDEKNECNHHGHIHAVRHLLALHSLSCGLWNIRTDA